MPPSRVQTRRFLLLAAATFALAGVREAAATPGPAVQAEGVVVYSDPKWGIVFLQDGWRVTAIETLGAAVPPRGRRARATGVVARVRGRRALLARTWSDLGDGVAPAAVAQGSCRGLAEPCWTTVDAFVRESRGEVDRAFLEVAPATAAIEVHVPAALPPDARVAAVGARLRLTGVLEPPTDAWSHARLWVPGWDAVEVTSPSPDWPTVPLRTLGELSASRVGVEGEIRVRVHAAARRSLHTFEVRDETGRMDADLEPPDTINETAAYDVRAFVGQRRGRRVLLDARWRAASERSPEDPMPPRPPAVPALTTVAAVRALPREQAERGLAVRLRGVVTYYEPAVAMLFVQDATGGLYVYPGHDDIGVRPGDLVQVEGRTGGGQLAPIVVSPRFTRLGPAELPTPRQSTATRLATAQDDCRRVETSGVVRSVHRLSAQTRLSLAADGQRITVVVPDGAGPFDAAGLVDARVRVRAVCGTAFNWRGQLLGIQLFVARLRDLEVEQPAGGPPFALAPTAVRDVLRGGAEERWGRLTLVRGVVLDHRRGQPLYLRDGTGTLVATGAGLQPVSPGDRVDVVGFPAPDPFAPRLEEAVVRLVGAGEDPVPVTLDTGQLLGGAHDADLVRLEATLLNVIRRDSDTALLVRAGEAVLEARGGGDLPDERSLEPGSRLGIDGVLLAGHDDSGDQPLLRLSLRGPADVRVLQRPPWWSPVRAAWASAGLLLVLLLSFAWVSTLRRQVRGNTDALRRSEESYRLLAENASDVIVTLDRSLRLTYVSPSVERQTGYSPAEAVRLPLSKVLATESWAALRREMDKAVRPAEAGQGLTALEVEVVGKDGSRRWNEVRLSVLRDDTGRFAGYLGVVRDVSARRQAQQERVRLAAAVEHAAEAVMLTDERGRITYVNPAFERVTGWSASEVLGGSPAFLQSGAHDRAFYENLWATIRAGRVWEGRFSNRRKDGSHFIEDASISPIRDASGRTIGYVAVKRDVSRQVQLETHLANTQKLEAVGRLAAGVAHDFNNLLAAISGFADLLLRRVEDERQRTYVTGIRDAAMRGAALTRQILTFSRQSAPELRPVDLGPVVEEACRLLRALLPPEVEIGVSVPPGPAVAIADPNQVHQVILNLGTNGGLAMRGRGGLLEVSLGVVELAEPFSLRHPPLRPGRHLRLTVADSGCGMSPDVLERVFEPFFTTRSNGEGTGMGLSVVHGIVHRHGGVITAESAPGRGSTFRVYLPTDTSPNAATMAEPAAAPAGSQGPAAAAPPAG